MKTCDLCSESFSIDRKDDFFTEIQRHIDEIDDNIRHLKGYQSTNTPKNSSSNSRNTRIAYLRKDLTEVMVRLKNCSQFDWDKNAMKAVKYVKCLKEILDISDNN